MLGLFLLLGLFLGRPFLRATAVLDFSFSGAFWTFGIRKDRILCARSATAVR